MEKEIQVAEKFGRWTSLCIAASLYAKTSGHSPSCPLTRPVRRTYIVRWYICAFSFLLLLLFLAALVRVLHKGAAVYCYCLHKLYTHSGEHFYCSHFCFLYTLNSLWSLVSYISKLLGFWIFSSWFCAVVLWTIYYWWLCSRHARLPSSGCPSPTGVLSCSHLQGISMSCKEWDVTPCSSVHVHRSFLQETTSSTILKFETCCLIVSGYLVGLTLFRNVGELPPDCRTSDPVSYINADFGPLLWIPTGSLQDRGGASRSCDYKLNVWAIRDFLYWSP
jgi:hypothetical protein